MDYPSIERDNIDFSSSSDICNIGYHEGSLRDGRPYRLEVWSSNGLDTATIFISNIGLEGKSEVDLVKYISGEGIIDVDDDRDLAIEYGISSIPCLILFENGKEVKRSVGLVPVNEIESLFED